MIASAGLLHAAGGDWDVREKRRALTENTPRTARGKSKGGIRPMHGRESVAEVCRSLVVNLSQRRTLSRSSVDS